MARKKEPQKLEAIAEAAISCFTDLGVRRTQMTDVAKAAGVSAGTLYLYVSSKEALFHLAILRLCARPWVSSVRSGARVLHRTCTPSASCSSSAASVH